MDNMYALILGTVFVPLLGCFAEEESDWDRVREIGLEPGKTYNISSGTGFYITPDYLITNAHVVQNCLNISVRGAVPPSTAQLIAKDDGHDLALLRTNTESSRVAYLRSNEGLKSGDMVFVIGYPLQHSNTGDYLLGQANVISMDAPVEEASNIEFTAAVEKGNSGGPLIDYAGNIVGIVQAKKNYYYLSAGHQDVAPADIPFKINGLAIGLGRIKTFLAEHNVNYADNTSIDMFTNYHPDTQAKDYIVNVHCVHN